MIIVGLVLLLIGILLAIPILYTLGIILIVVGAVLWAVGSLGGRPVVGRRPWSFLKCSQRPDRLPRWR